MRSFLDLDDLDDERLAAVLGRAKVYAAGGGGRPLAGRVVGLVFLNPSLRTLASMQAGVAQLGGSTLVITPGVSSWQLEMRDGVVMDGEAAEHVREAIPVLGSYCDLLAVRCFARGVNLEEDISDWVIRKMAALSPVPFVNLESAAAHPCQALADWKTLDDLAIPRNGKFVLSWVYHPRPLPFAVPASALAMAARRGMRVTVLRPRGYALPEPLMARARALAAASGGSVEESEDRAAAMAGAHVIYAKSWACPAAYGRPEEERERRRGLISWCVGEEWFAGAAPEAKFMHCLPVRRNVKVTDEVLDGPRSAVLEQAANRLHVQKALLVEMLGGVER